MAKGRASVCRVCGEARRDGDEEWFRVYRFKENAGVTTGIVAQFCRICWVSALVALGEDHA